MTQKSLYEIELESEAGRHALAAAAAAGRVGALLEQTFAKSGLTQDILAEKLGVSKGRVSQVLHGDGNVHVATAARFLDAMGFRLELDAVDKASSPVRSTRMPRIDREVKSPSFDQWVDAVIPSTLTLRHTAQLQLSPVFSSHALVDMSTRWADFTAVMEYQNGIEVAISAEDLSSIRHG